jgi:uncharacterized protein (DUF1800 family)
MWATSFDALRLLVALAIGLMLAACGDSARQDRASVPVPASATLPETQASNGQVAPASPGSPFGITTYAAARFLDQASFGPTPQSIAEVKRLGFAGWIDAQLASPPEVIDGAVLLNRGPPGVPDPFAGTFLATQFSRLAIAAPGQLRMRASWALSQFVVVSQNKVDAFGSVQYANFLMSRVFSSYRDFLRAVTIQPSMGFYLDNGDNRAASACVGCAPNENYARELLQLFSVGVFKLNADGSTQRDAQGIPLETYTQDDVQDLARALTGWAYVAQAGLPRENWANYGKQMVPSRSADHDSGAKRILGRDIPAGQDAVKDLDSVIAIIMAHPNVAPFVSLRFIQHLVASDPSPEYIRRIAAVFDNDGSGSKGNLGAVVKAILLDPEARRGDVPAAASPRAGLIREPFLATMGRWRGLGCRELPVGVNSTLAALEFAQQPFIAPSVFSFYLPTDRAPGSLLLAPEQGMLNGVTLRSRFSDFGYHVDQGSEKIAAAGCNFDEFEQALIRSPDHYLDLVSARYFRGALPATLRATAIDLAARSPWMTPRVRAANLLSYLLLSSSYGAMK